LIFSLARFFPLFFINMTRATFLLVGGYLSLSQREEIRLGLPFPPRLRSEEDEVVLFPGVPAKYLFPPALVERGIPDLCFSSFLTRPLFQHPPVSMELFPPLWLVNHPAHHRGLFCRRGKVKLLFPSFLEASFLKVGFRKSPTLSFGGKRPVLFFFRLRPPVKRKALFPSLWRLFFLPPYTLESTLILFSLRKSYPFPHWLRVSLSISLRGSARPQGRKGTCFFTIQSWMVLFPHGRSCFFL